MSGETTIIEEVGSVEFLLTGRTIPQIPLPLKEIHSIDLFIGDMRYDVSSELPVGWTSYLWWQSCVFLKGVAFSEPRFEKIHDEPSIPPYTCPSSYLATIFHEIRHAHQQQESINDGKTRRNYHHLVRKMDKEVTFDDVVHMMSEEYDAWEYAYHKLQTFTLSAKAQDAMAKYIAGSLEDYLAGIRDYRSTILMGIPPSWEDIPYHCVLDIIEEKSGRKKEEMSSELLATHSSWIIKQLGDKYLSLDYLK